MPVLSTRVSPAILITVRFNTARRPTRGSLHAIEYTAHFESFNHINDAIAREKEIKMWPRQKKIQLIEAHNPTWLDLAAHLPMTYKKPQKQTTVKPETSKADSKDGG